MKKLTFSVAIIATLGLASCGSSEYDEVCECAEMALEMQKEAEGKGLEEMAKIMDKYKADFEKCEKTFKDMDEKHKNLSDSEKKAKEKEMEESCDAIKELNDLRDASM